MSFGELLFSTGIIQRERKQGLNWRNTTKLDRDKRTHQKTLEGMRGHGTKAETKRPPEEAAHPPIG
jgi:hypothetical protein